MSMRLRLFFDEDLNEPVKLQEEESGQRDEVIHTMLYEGSQVDETTLYLGQTYTGDKIIEYQDITLEADPDLDDIEWVTLEYKLPDGTFSKNVSPSDGQYNEPIAIQRRVTIDTITEPVTTLNIHNLTYDMEEVLE